MSKINFIPDIRKYDRVWQVAAVGVILAGILFYFLHFTYTYFDISKQTYLGWGCCIAIFLMYKVKKFRQQPLRLIFICLSAFLAFRYIQWRAFDTLLYTGPLDFIGMSLLFLAEVYGLAIYFMGMFVNVWPLESKHIPLPKETEQLPTVDVFIATYNEPDDIIRTTATAAIQMDYPKEKFRVYLIDDGGTEAKRNDPENGMEAWKRHYRLRQMAAELGIGYLTRETNQQAKAGNINHALQYTDGELVLFLDCDHVPTKDILQYTVGHFIADPKLFLAQTPHFFINPTPMEKNLEGMSDFSGENDLFYRRIHPSLNFWNASYFCGSAAVLRRKYLIEVGGISGATITEDAETAFLLHSHGYNSIYINRPMVCGLSPESYDGYVIQRSRWAQGMVQLVLLNNPLGRKGLSLPQRIAYFNSSFFWFFGFSRFIYFIAPAAYLILGLSMYNASWLQIVAFTLPYVLSVYISMDYFYHGTRQPFFSEIYESVQSLFLIPAVLSVLLNPWKPSFKVTSKGLTNEKNYLSPLAAPFFLVIAINVIAVIMAYIKWINEPMLHDVIVVTVIWSIYNLYLALVSLGAFWERKQIRKFHRIRAGGLVAVHFPRMGTSHTGEVCDVSLTGIGFEIQLPFLPREHEQVVLEVKDSYGREYRFENYIRRAVSLGGKYYCGSEFITEHVSYADVISYVFGDSRRWQENWERKSEAHGTYRMLWYFMKTGVQGFLGSVVPLFLLASRKLWKLAVKWTTTPILRDKILAITSWCVYYFYLAVATLLEYLDHKHVRILPRIHVSGSATIYFPRLDATLIGDVEDVSLTGAGIIAELPFKIRERERVTIKMNGKDGKGYQFASVIERVIERGEKSLCGANFIVDVSSYAKIVRFVYGDSLHMLRYVLASGGRLLGRGGAGTTGVFARMMKAVAAALSFIFLNPETRAGERNK